MPLFLSAILLAFSLPPIALGNWDGLLVSPSSQKTLSLEELVQTMKPGQVVLMGEQHDYQPDHTNQVLLLQQLAAANPQLAISVGMEFFDYPRQPIVDDYLQGKLTDVDFLQQVAWGSDDYSQYRTQVNFPKSHGGACFALNLPRSISGAIATNGVENLNASQSAFLPPNFTLGRKSYQDRFNQLMADSHQTVPPQDLQHYFEAQSSWDDTMAWKIIESMEKNPNQLLFVIVGKFHVQYGGGLPDRLRGRGFNNLITITQYAASQGSLDDLKKEISIDPNYGAISDFVWMQGEPK